MPYSTPIRSQPFDDLISVVELWFDDRYQADDENWPGGMFLIRGGVCWPEHYDPRTESVSGCAILTAYNLRTDVAYVFEERTFACIDHMIDPRTRQVAHPGLAPWFLQAWAKYHGDTFYVSQPDPVRDRWERECRHSAALSQIAPRFVPAPEWGDVSRGENLIWEWITRRRVKRFAGEPIDQAIRAYRKGEEKVLPAPLHALACCLSGMDGQIEQAREISRGPRPAVRIENQLMRDHPRDWRGNT